MSMPNPRRHVSAAVHSLLVFRLHDMELDLQMVDGGLVDFRRGARQQLLNQLLRLCRSRRSEARIPRIPATG